MASKRLMLDMDEEEEGDGEGACGRKKLEDGQEYQAKRRKPAGQQETPLQRMLKRHIPASAILSPIICHLFVFGVGKTNVVKIK